MNANAVIKSTLVGGLSRTLGAPADAQSITWRPWQGSLVVERLTAVDPSNPARNLFQIERGEFQVHGPSLFYRQLRLQNGQFVGVQLGTPRASKESLGTGLNPEEAGRLPWNMKGLWTVNARRAGQRWLDTWPHDARVVDAGPTTPPAQHADQLQREWQQRFDELERRVADLVAMGSAIQSQLDSPHPNPLRQADYWTSLHEKLAEARQLSKGLANEIEAAKGALPNVAQQVSQAFRPAPDTTNTPLPPTPIELYAELLHADEMCGLLNEVMILCNQALVGIPEIPHPAASWPGQGREIHFRDQQRLPSVVIDSLEVDGSLLWSGQRIQYAGKIEGLSSDPARHDLPIEFQFRAQGEEHFIVGGAIDRRGGKIADTISIRCPSLAMPATTLGDGAVLSIAAAPRRMQVELQISLDDQRLTGRATMTYSDVALHVDQIHEDLGGSAMAIALNRRLGEIGNYQTQVEFEVNGERAEMRIQSDLADHFSRAVLESQDGLQRDRMQQRQAESERQMLAAIDELNRTFAQRLTVIQDKLGEQAERFAGLADRMANANPEIRRR